MLSKLFLGMTLAGAEWVLYLLFFTSIVSIGIIFERIYFYQATVKGLSEFRKKIRHAVTHTKWEEAIQEAQNRVHQKSKNLPDLETEMVFSLLYYFLSSDLPKKRGNIHSHISPEAITEIARDSVLRAKLSWDRNIHFLATISSNAPFLGLFGTVLGIIKAFHDLSLQGGGGTGTQAVTAGISEALVATAVGLIVAIPAAIAFNFFQKRIKSAMMEAEALKSFLIGKLIYQNVNEP